MPFMNESPADYINDAWILQHRPGREHIQPDKPYAVLTEPEHQPDGSTEEVTTVFLSNRECPFRCLMCDLWRYTLAYTVSPDQLATQVEQGIDLFPQNRHIKLYNAGSFFDKKAIPPDALATIAHLLKKQKSILVENHPRLTDDRCLPFRDALAGELHIAMGLETVHPKVLPLLNKKMTLADFARSARFLSKNNIPARAFILLRPPFLSEEEGIHWAQKSIDFAHEHGVECCVVIPTRAGNGAMEKLQQQGHFAPPSIRALEEVVEYGISRHHGRVFADLWDLEIFSTCTLCFEKRKSRLEQMNHHQRKVDAIHCSCSK